MTVAIRPWKIDVIEADRHVETWTGRAVEIIDMSGDGARMRVRCDVRLDDRLALDFAYRGREFTIPGRVVWVAPPDADDGDEDGAPASEVGISFEDVADLTRARLESVLGQRGAPNRPGSSTIAS